MTDDAGSVSIWAGNVSIGAGKVTDWAGSVSFPAGNVTDDPGNVSNGAGRVSANAGKVSNWVGNVSFHAGRVSINAGRVSDGQKTVKNTKQPGLSDRAFEGGQKETVLLVLGGFTRNPRTTLPPSAKRHLDFGHCLLRLPDANGQPTM